jgi:hypothetical protein
MKSSEGKRKAEFSENKKQLTEPEIPHRSLRFSVRAPFIRLAAVTARKTRRGLLSGFALAY